MKKSVSQFIAGILMGILISVSGFALYVKHGKSGVNAGQGEQTVIKLAHNLDSKHPVNIALEKMKDRLDELSGGKMTLDIHGGGVLGGTSDCIEQLQSGVLDISTSSAAFMEAFVPELGVFSLPYIFFDNNHYWKVLNSELGKKLLQSGENKKLRGLCYFDAGSRSFYTKDKAINVPADLKSLKVRVMGSKIAMDMVKALGGAPTPISFGELYTALQQGVVDAAENNPPSFYTNKHHNVCKRLSMDEHTRVPDMLLISTLTWNKLSSQQQKWLQQAADEASAYQRKLWDEKTKDALKKVQEEGVIVNYPDKKPFMEKVKPMLKSYDGTKIGKILKEIEAMHTEDKKAK